MALIALGILLIMYNVFIALEVLGLIYIINDKKTDFV